MDEKNAETLFQSGKWVWIFQFRYVPTRLWGFSGHFQTVFHSIVGRVRCPWPLGERVFLGLEDGSTLTYDLYQPINEPNGAQSLIARQWFDKSFNFSARFAFARHRWCQRGDMSWHRELVGNGVHPDDRPSGAVSRVPRGCAESHRGSSERRSDVLQNILIRWV